MMDLIATIMCILVLLGHIMRTFASEPEKLRPPFNTEMRTVRMAVWLLLLITFYYLLVEK